MESLGMYLLKSAVWLTGFTLVFLAVLRNERYFQLNRIYLLLGVFASVVFPLLTWHYAVIMPAMKVAFTTTSDFSAIATTAPVTSTIAVYWWLYLVGTVLIALRLIWQTVAVVRKLRKTHYVKTGSVKLVRTTEYDCSFSFFSFVFVNPSTSDIETNEIVNHEREHINQMHWLDLLLVEMLCMLQWFNPFVWIYARLIRQNHEYLADEMALRRTADPAIYQATLLNQMFGASVISLANSFNYSLNKKRFKMMKKKINSPLRKLKVLLVLPLVAIVFYAFAKPEYVSSEQTFPISNVSLNADNQDVKGKVLNPDGKPLAGTSVIIKGTTKGTVTDKNGEFDLKNVPYDTELVFSYVGLETRVIKADSKNSMAVKMVSAPIGIGKISVVALVNPSGPPPPPPPPPSADGIKIKPIDSQNPPLILLDGTIIDKTKMDAINPDDMESMYVLKDKASTTDLYGEKAKNGVIMITTKIKPSASNDSKSSKVYNVVEEMPEYPGGIQELRDFCVKNIKYPIAAMKMNAQGIVIVNFVVNSRGKVEGAKIVRGVHPSIDAEAIRIVGMLSSKSDWKPGKQHGLAVDVSYTIPIEFLLQ